PATVLGQAPRLRAVADGAARRHAWPRRAVAGPRARQARLPRPVPTRHPPGAVAIGPGEPSARRRHRVGGARIERGVLSMDIADLLPRLASRWWVVAAVTGLTVLAAA